MIRCPKCKAKADKIKLEFSTVVSFCISDASTNSKIFYDPNSNNTDMNPMEGKDVLLVCLNCYHEWKPKSSCLFAEKFHL